MHTLPALLVLTSAYPCTLSPTLAHFPRRLLAPAPVANRLPPAVCSLPLPCCLLMNAPRPPARPDIGDPFMGATTNSRERLQTSDDRLQTIWERLQIPTRLLYKSRRRYKSPRPCATNHRAHRYKSSRPARACITTMCAVPKTVVVVAVVC
ncbi:hypothetical protein K523DRAFT_321562 [Schizophyllum commune Tattone D]|nr:hypothetical protein K523DRAFT_321562 [Schizophyllum commune Tattone D]